MMFRVPRTMADDPRISKNGHCIHFQEQKNFFRIFTEMLFINLCFGTIWAFYILKPQANKWGSPPKQLKKILQGFFSVRSNKKSRLTDTGSSVQRLSC
jgi:hypothetical protein